MIEASNVKKNFGARTVVGGVSFSVGIFRSARERSRSAGTTLRKIRWKPNSCSGICPKTLPPIRI